MLDDSIATSIAEMLGERKSNHLEQQVEGYRQQINHLTEMTARHQQNITQCLRQMAENRDLLNIAQSAAENRSFADHLVEEWDELCKHPRLENARMDGGVITLVTTDDIRLHCEDREETRWLGAFEIILNLDTGEINLKNLNTRRGGRDHPHVTNGYPCFGGDHGVFSELLSAGSLHLLFEMLLQYLEKLNLADEYGAYGSYWFDQPDARPEGAPAPPNPLGLTEFIRRYGEVEFVCEGGPNRTDTPGRRGRAVGAVEGEIEWLDNNETDYRGEGLIVARVPDESETLDQLIEEVLA